MTPTEVFSIAGMIVMPMWILMILLPKWKVTQFLSEYKVIPILLSLVYVIYIIKAIIIGGPMDFGSLASVMQLFTEEHAVLAGWIHYLAFDLLIGIWMLNENKKLKIHQLIMAPCLFATFMFGPAGFLLFILIRTFKQKKS
ncbi:ABA4-like family protein [Aquimarina pacifica]|uniref:ABA4-like family protein n=1 Tax=Aquimarina pacifica TaxID=1296415 RepID=UPI00047048EB|nr:ABA4-like family protein [Aquimarina pacifica]